MYAVRTHRRGSSGGVGGGIPGARGRGVFEHETRSEGAVGERKAKAREGVPSPSRRGGGGASTYPRSMSALSSFIVINWSDCVKRMQGCFIGLPIRSFGLRNRIMTNTRKSCRPSSARNRLVFIEKEPNREVVGGGDEGRLQILGGGVGREGVEPEGGMVSSPECCVPPSCLRDGSFGGHDGVHVSA